MNNIYLFRAKRIDNGKWVEGIPLFYKDGSITIYGQKQAQTVGFHIQNNGYCDRNTICQCTGLKDKNGKLIWENDVVRFKHEKFDFDDGLEPWERSCLPNKKEYTRNYAVEFCNTSTHYGLRFRNKSIWFMVHRMTVVMHDVEVIGNIFDSPELMHE